MARAASMVAARAGDELVKAELAARFQEAIDEAAMDRDTAANAYLEGWERSPWTAADGTPARCWIGSWPSWTDSGRPTGSPATSTGWAAERLFHRPSGFQPAVSS